MRIRESYTYQSNDNYCNGAQLEQLACFVAALARSCYLDSSSGGYIYVNPRKTVKHIIIQLANFRLVSKTYFLMYDA